MFKRVEKTFAAVHGSMAEIVERQTIHVIAKSIEEFRKKFDEFVVVHAEFIPTGYPAWTAIGNAVLLAKNAVVEMRVVAVVGAGKSVVVERAKLALGKK